jgi:5-formyltetrahydrofolate cyclo-ligase
MESKQQARAISLSSRVSRTVAQLQQDERGLLAHDWAALCPGDLVTCYVAMAGEPPTDLLRAHLQSIGKTVLLPIMKPNNELAWGVDQGELVTNSYGVAEPIETGISLDNATLMIIPALRAGRDGTRLGRGAGYYDRILEKTKSSKTGGPLRLVLVFDDELDNSVPHESHDQKMDGIITPTKLLLIKNKIAN